MQDPVQLFCVTPEGVRPVPLDASIQSVHQIMDPVDSGVYTGMRTFDGERFLGLEEHLDRLACSMELKGIAWPLDRVALRSGLAEVVEPFQKLGMDSFLRIDALPAESHYPGTDCRLLISRGPLPRVPQAFKDEGVQVYIAKDLNRVAPSVKSAAFVRARRPYPVGTQECYEHLLVDDAGNILEATSSNFYGIVNGELRTASSDMLAGITRRFLLFLCAGLEIPVNTTAIRVDQLNELDEAFLTSSTRGIVPVVAVGDSPIGDGHPGPFTRSLMRAYGVLCARSPSPAQRADLHSTE